MGWLEDLVIAVLGIFSFLHLLNLTAGVIELIPDNIPLIGNLDEAGATALLIGALKHFNILDITDVFGDFRVRGRPGRG